MRKPQNQGICGSEEYWNADITWNEVQKIVKTMGNGKASGIDGIPGEVYKAIIRCKWPRDGKGLACILLRVLNAILNGKMQMASRWKGLGVYIAESAECHLEWEYTRGLDDFDDSFGTEEGSSDSSAYQLCV